MHHNDYAPAERAAMRQEGAWPNASCDGTWSPSSINSHIAYALARDYIDLFYVNMQSGEFVEYASDDDRGTLVEIRRGGGFFESCKREAKLFVHPEDQDAFVGAMNREYLLGALDQSDEFQMAYRRVKDGRSFYVQMRVTRMRDDDRFIVVAVWDIDELVMKRREGERIREERIVYARLHAITGNFMVVYVVEPETDHFREFNSTEEFERSFTQAKEGDDFFQRLREMTCRFIHPADIGRFMASFTKKNILAAIERDGIFTLGYRLMMGGVPKHVQVKAAMVEESKGPRLIVGLNDIDAQVLQEEEAVRRLERAQKQASIDALTGVKNRNAYLEVEERLNSQIERQLKPPFAIVVLDVNDLKRVNDTQGHRAGDQYLREACRVVCDIFKHSPVFRVGGDEFAVVAQGVDLAQIEERVAEMRRHNEEALKSGGVVVACGMARFEGDGRVADVFDRADRRMYEEKNSLKEKAAQTDES